MIPELALYLQPEVLGTEGSCPVTGVIVQLECRTCIDENIADPVRIPITVIALLGGGGEGCHCGRCKKQNSERFHTKGYQCNLVNKCKKIPA